MSTLDVPVARVAILERSLKGASLFMVKETALAIKNGRANSDWHREQTRGYFQLTVMPGLFDASGKDTLAARACADSKAAGRLRVP